MRKRNTKSSRAKTDISGAKMQPMPKAQVIVLVDDEQTFLNEFTQKLHSWFPKYEIIARESAVQARNALRKVEQDKVELAIVDVVLTSRDEFLGILQFMTRRFPDARRLAITQIAPRESIGELINRPLVDGYVDKEWLKRPHGENRVRRQIWDLLKSPREVPGHTQIVEAIRAWIQRAPKELKERKIVVLGHAPLTLDDLLREIEEGTAFGKRQERLLYEIALDAWQSQPQDS